MKRVISIDLGGTNLKAALVDQEANILRRLTVPTNKMGRTALIEQLAGVMKKLGQDVEIEAVGIGTPGFVNREAGRVLLATNLSEWTGTDVEDELHRIISLPIVVENDANVAALGEAWVGAGRNLDSFFMITLGTGVGGAIFARSTGIWNGASYRGGEVGHAILYPGGKPCACGQQGCVEQYLSGRSIEATFEQLAGKRLRCPEIFAAAAVGHEQATPIVNRFCSDLAVLLTSLNNIFDPAGFIIGGGLVHLRQFWWAKVQQAFQTQCMHGEAVALLPATTGNSAGLLGAAYLALGLKREHLDESNS
jgi:glucokinase